MCSLDLMSPYAFTPSVQVGKAITNIQETKRTPRRRGNNPHVPPTLQAGHVHNKTHVLA